MTGQAFKTLFFEYYPEFFSYADAFLHDPVASREVTTGALLLLWNKHKDFDRKKDRTFLYLSIRNACLYRIKYHRDNPAAACRDNGAAKMLEESELPEDILQDIFTYIAGPL